MVNLITLFKRKPKRKLTMVELGVLCYIVSNEHLRVQKTDTVSIDIISYLQDNGYCQNTAKETETFMDCIATDKGQEIIRKELMPVYS